MISMLTEYLFNPRPHTFNVWGIFFLSSAAIALVLSLSIYTSLKKLPPLYRKPIKKARTGLIWYGVVSVFLYFVRMERVPYFSARIILWTWCIGFVLIFALIIYIEIKKIPGRREKIAKSAKQKRYFE